MRTSLRLARVRALAASGEALKIREAHGLTRGDVARDVVVSLATVRRWEVGERTPTGAAALRYERLLSRLQEMTPEPAA